MNAVKKWVFCVVTRLVLDPKKTGSPSKQKESERKSNLLPGQGTEKKKNEALRKWNYGVVTWHIVDVACASVKVIILFLCAFVKEAPPGVIFLTSFQPKKWRQVRSGEWWCPVRY